MEKLENATDAVIKGANKVSKQTEMEEAANPLAGSKKGRKHPSSP
jgi:hypothetical protein